MQPKLSRLRNLQLESLEDRMTPSLSSWWGSADIGGSATVGFSSADGSQLQGTGTGFGGTSDRHFLHYRELTGDDGAIVARLDTLQASNSTAASGLVIRDDLNPDSRFAAVTKSTSGQLTFLYRATVGAAATSTVYQGAAAAWVKLVRDGQLFSAYTSSTGADGSWTLVGTTALAMDSVVDIGQTVASGSSSALASAAFMSVDVSSDPPIGANLEGITDWARSNAFTDIMKQVRFYASSANTDVETARDAAGWPMANFSVVIQSGDGTGLASIYNGVYKLSFKGQASIDSWFSSGITISNKQYNSTTQTTTADVTLNQSNSNSGWYFTLRFTNTQRPGQGTNTGLTDLKLIRPQTTPTGVTMWTDPNQTFTTPFLNHLQRFSTLRFMDWAETNNSTIVNWSDRQLPTARQTGKGVAWEYIIELANTLGKDVWINVPAQASDDYITQLATLFRNTLRPDLAVYVEYSNEVWNSGFDQSQWNRQQAQAEVAAGIGNLNYDGRSDADVEARRIGEQIKRISDIFRTVWGDAAMNTRVRPVLASQITWPDRWLMEALEYLHNVAGAPVSNYLYAAAGAPYFNMQDQDVAGLSTSQVLDLLAGSVADWNTNALYSENVALAQSEGLRFIGYEGGPDTYGSNNIEAKKAASLDPRMSTIVQDYLRGWYQAGGGLFMWFTAGASNWDDEHGTWGLKTDMTLPDSSFPKVVAIDTILSGGSITQTRGQSIPALISSGSNLNMWLGPIDRRLYQVNAPVGGTWQLAVNYSTSTASGSDIVVSVDGKIFPLHLPKTSSQYVDFAPFNVELKPGVNTIDLRVISGSLNFGGFRFTNKQTQTVLASVVPNASDYLQPVTLTATVTGASGTPGGTVTFLSDGASIGTATLNASGVATLAVSNLASGYHLFSAVYGGNTNFVTSTSPQISWNVVNNSTPAPTVSSVTINNGDAQRNRITTMAVTFDSVVNIMAGAFAITGVSPTGVALTGVVVSFTTQVVNGYTIATLTFSGTNTDFGSLKDGRWTLVIDHTKVSVNSVTMAADYNSAAAGLSIVRLFGDTDGDGDVDAVDSLKLLQANGSVVGQSNYRAEFDFDGDGDVDALDVLRFRQRIGSAVS